MNYLSICSGIEAATVAWHHMGWQPAGFAEIEKFPAQVLAHHYPNVRNYGDLTKHDTWGIEAGSVDLLVGGTPCQAFSVAGLRRGMEDERGQLTLEFARLAQRLRPRWIVWENVPGVLSSGGGRDFGSFLGALAQLGYGYAYRVLDAQYFGVAQRRRRVFVVGYLGDWRRAAAVLFERESVRGDSAPSRKAGENVAARTRAGAAVSSGHGYWLDAEERAATLRAQDSINKADTLISPPCTIQAQRVVGALDCRIGAQRAQNAQSGHMIPTVAHSLRARHDGGEDGTGRGTPLVPSWPAEVAPTLNAAFGTKQGLEDQHALGGAGCFVPALPIAFHNSQDPDVSGDMTHPLGAKDNGLGVGIPTPVVQPVAFKESQSGCRLGPVHATLDSNKGSRRMEGVMMAMAVRRLTPVECERLQGFPDGYTDIKPRGKDTPDGPRYKALGNSMAVPVMRWIGERIEAVDKLSR